MTAAIVAAITSRVETGWTYNLTIADAHAYNVGDVRRFRGRCTEQGNGMTLSHLGRRGNLQLAKDEHRAFPGLLVQGDTLFILLQDLEEEAPQSVAAVTVRDWVAAYEAMMTDAGLDLPYYRGPA